MLHPQRRLVTATWQAGHITFLDEDSWEAYYPYPIAFPASTHNIATYVVDRLEDNAIVFSTWDRLYTYYFVAHVEQQRLGLAFHEEFVPGSPASCRYGQGCAPLTTSRELPNSAAIS